MASLADLLGLSSAAAAAPQVGQDMTPEQLNALPYVNVAGRAPAAATPAAAPQQDHVSPIRDFLGKLGDAFLVGSGAQPMYQPRRDAERLSSAISSYLGNGDKQLAAVFDADPATGMQLYKMVHPAEPDFLRDMRAAGIDPTTDEGRQLVAAHFGKQPSASIQDYQYARSNGYQGDFASFVRDYLRPQLQAPVMIPAGAVPVGQAGGGKPNLRLNPQTGQWEPE